MAAYKFKKDESYSDYSSELKKIKNNGLKSLYFIRGDEDYLKENIFSEIKTAAFASQDDSFNHKLFSGPSIDAHELSLAVDTMPFLSDRILIEIRNVEISKLRSPDEIISVFDKIPEYSTVVWIASSNDEIDFRLKLPKYLREHAVDICFGPQSESQLLRWISRRFASCGKSIPLEVAERLLFLSGELMNNLINEIEKIAAFSKSPLITMSDVDNTVVPIPEARIFELIDRISEGNNAEALRNLEALIADKDTEPIMVMAVLGTQFHRLFLVSAAQTEELKEDRQLALLGLNRGRIFIFNKLRFQAKFFGTLKLKKAISICAETDFKMKSSSYDNSDLLREAVLRIITL